METRTIGRIRQTIVGLVAVVSLLLMAAAPVAAHPHVASVAHQGAGQVLANGQNHGPYVPGTGVSCGGDPAGYGLETCWRDYRLGMLQIPLITTLGFAFSAATDRGDDMTLTMLERGCAAIHELRTLDLVVRRSHPDETSAK